MRFSLDYERNLPIGVFDSGIGGLTVLEQLIKQFPNEKFIYVADQIYCPYGSKPAEKIIARAQKIIAYLLSRRVKAIVVACGTASVHIERVSEVTSIPVIGVIQPTCCKAVELTVNKKIAVLATESTINSGAYSNILVQNGINCIPLICGEFVDFLENCDLYDPSGEKLVADKLNLIKDEGMDVLIHGCTHFSLLEPQMRKVLGNNITYVACGQPTGEHLGKILIKKNLCCTITGRGSVEIYTTGSEKNAQRTMKWFTAAHAHVQHIDINQE